MTMCQTQMDTRQKESESTPKSTRGRPLKPHEEGSLHFFHKHLNLERINKQVYATEKGLSFCLPGRLILPLPSRFKALIKKCQVRHGEGGGGGLAGISPCLWSLLSQAGNVCAGCQCASDQALHTDLLPGNAAGLRDRRHTQDSDAAEKSSLLHLNRGRHAGTGGSRRIGWMLKHSWNVHYEFWMWFVEARMWPESGRTKTFFFF